MLVKEATGKLYWSPMVTSETNGCQRREAIPLYNFNKNYVFLSLKASGSISIALIFSYISFIRFPFVIFVTLITINCINHHCIDSWTVFYTLVFTFKTLVTTEISLSLNWKQYIKMNCDCWNRPRIYVCIYYFLILSTNLKVRLKVILFWLS